jgi:TetR/AcrR family transcriptional regulator
MPRDTFNKISEEKRERVLREAAWLFAEKGYVQADMAALASRAGVSKGSLYDYFDNKEDLYLHVCRDGLQRSRKAVYGEINPDWDLYEQVKHIFRRGAAFAQSNPEYVALYLNFASAGMGHFAEQLSLEVEEYTAGHLKKLIRDGIDKGLIRPDIDVNLTAFIINSLYIIFLGSFVSSHFRIRIKEYLEINGEPMGQAIERRMKQTISMIENFLRPGRNERLSMQND